MTGAVDQEDGGDEVVLLVSEDWFAASHFLPLIAEIAGVGGRVRVLTRINPDGTASAALEAAGAHVENFEYGRNSLSPFKQAAIVRALRSRIAAIRPAVVHSVGQHVIVLAGIAVGIAPRATFVMHLTGRGVLATARGAKAVTFRTLLRASVRAQLRRGAVLMVENSDDVRDVMDGQRSEPTLEKTSSPYVLVPGAGVDPDIFKPVPPPSGPAKVVTGVGRMLTIKGWPVLASAAEKLRARGVAFEARVYGAPDINPAAVPEDVLAAWAADGSPLKWCGPTTDVPAVWAGSDMAVVPTLGGEGVPRSLIEAAACGRPLIVTDVPGCRDLVRDGVEGLIVPPGDSTALADAIQRLVEDPDQRIRFGAAARARVLERYTEAHVRSVYQSVYQNLLTLSGEAELVR